MTGRIYRLDDDNSNLVPMDEAPYESEKLLQQLLAKYPDLLAGEQINSDEPRRWVLVTREMSVPGDQDGLGKWSLDHLFLDQDAIPTLVEVKKSANSDIRRKVVGQMLDYAANAVAYWPVEQIRAKFESRCEAQGEVSQEVLAAHLGENHNADDFWQQVKTNLEAGRVRMVFIADVIPTELRRVVEFLNEQMNPAEVIAVEVKQFVGNGMKTLVPRVFGQTEKARQKKTVKPKEAKQWDEKTFLEELRATRGAKAALTAKEVFDWVSPQVSVMSWGTGPQNGSVIPTIKRNTTSYRLFRMATNGRFVFRFDWLKETPAFEAEASRRELLDKVNSIPGVHFSDDVLVKRARVPITTFCDGQAMQAVKSLIKWMIDRIEVVAGNERAD